MKIYLDSEFKCHLVDDGTMTAVETNAFDGKCATFIAGYRFVPDGANWTRPDGFSFKGEAISPWKDFTALDAAQRDYERQLLAEYAEALKVVGVSV